MDTRYTDIRLLKVPLEIDSKNQLTFANATAQANYFLSLNYLEVSDSSYQRKDSIIRYPENIDDLWAYNYVMYKNTNYSNKWFYAFITDMKYINDSMTEITIKTDVWQTWQFDIEYKNCFVEREHVNDDTIGKHTVPENVETGEFITNKTSVDFTYANNTYICFAISDVSILESGYEPSTRQYNKIFSGLQYLIVRDQTDAVNLIKIADAKGKSDSINSIFLIPQDEIISADFVYYDYRIAGESSDTRVWYFWIQPLSTADTIETKTVSIPTKIGDNYNPKNKKLFTRQFSSIVVSNNSGTSINYNYEDFSNNQSIQFRAYGAITPGCSIRLIPLNYKGVSENYEYSLIGAKLPICSWTTDVYTNWLTQNGVNIGLSVAGSLLSTGVGLFTGNPIGVASGILGVGQTIGQIYEHSLIPDSAKGNTNAGDVTFATGKSDFTIYFLSIKDEYAKIIDNFFSMFGYKVNAVKTPNVTGRQNWNYVKTIDCNIHAFIPQADCLEIKNMFNAGVTFWHNPSTFLDYSQNNPIV